MAPKAKNTSAVHSRKPTKPAAAPRLASKPPPRRPTAVHPIALEFSETLALSRGHLLARTLSTITATHHQHLARLADATALTSSYADTEATIHRTLTTPLAETVLRFVAEGNEARAGKIEAVTVGERMRGFEIRVRKGEEALRGLWEEWGAVQAEVEGVRGELRALMGGEEEEGGGKVRREWERLGAEIARVCEGAVGRCRESEKEMNVKSTRARKDMLRAIEAQY